MTSTERQHVRAAPPATPAPAHPEQPWSWDTGRDVVMPFSDQWDTGRDVLQTSAPAASGQPNHYNTEPGGNLNATTLSLDVVQTSAPAASCGQAISSPLQAPCVTTVTTVTGGDAWCEGLVPDQDAPGRGEAIRSSAHSTSADLVPERCYTTLSLDVNLPPARPAAQGVIEGALPRLGETDNHKRGSLEHKSDRQGASPPPDGANVDKVGSESSGRATGKKHMTVTGRIAAFLTGKKSTKTGR